MSMKYSPLYFFTKSYSALSPHLPKFLKKRFGPKGRQLLQNHIFKKKKQLNSEFVRLGDLVFDIGAYKGEMTDVYLELGGMIVSLEPNPEQASFLRQKFLQNKNVIVVEMGVGEKTEERPFYINKSSQGASSFSTKWKDDRFRDDLWSEKSVKLTTLDDLIKIYGIPAYIKIDAEGYEKLILKGLNTKVKFISFEFTRKYLDDIYSCLEVLSKFGRAQFNYSLATTHQLNLESKEWLDEETFKKAMGKIELSSVEGGDVYVKFI